MFLQSNMIMFEIRLKLAWNNIIEFGMITLVRHLNVTVNRNSYQERKLGDRRRSDTGLVLTISNAIWTLDAFIS